MFGGLKYSLYLSVGALEFGICDTPLSMVVGGI